MPGGDGTGPWGAGPMTGGGRGYCVMPLLDSRTIYPDRRFSFRAGGRGRRNCYYATGLTGWQRASMGYPAFRRGFYPTANPLMTAKEEVEILKEQARFLEESAREIKQRITDIETPTSKEE